LKNPSILETGRFLTRRKNSPLRFVNQQMGDLLTDENPMLARLPGHF
jgi:hypothetical protein